MTLPKTQPYPPDQMLDRDQIKTLSGCTLAEVFYVCKYQPNKFPNWCHQGPNRKFFYLKSDILKWLSKNDIKQIFKAKSVTKYGIRKSERQIFDIEAAVKFITAKPVDYVPVKKERRARPKTKVVHLQEIDLYTPMPYVNPWRSSSEAVIYE